jgi:hypothetical protein
MEFTPWQNHHPGKEEMAEDSMKINAAEQNSRQAAHEVTGTLRGW